MSFEDLLDQQAHDDGRWVPRCGCFACKRRRSEMDAKRGMSGDVLTPEQFALQGALARQSSLERQLMNERVKLVVVVQAFTKLARAVVNFLGAKYPDPDYLKWELSESLDAVDPMFPNRVR